MNRLDLPEYAEDAAILRFYRLDTLEPEVWVEDEEMESNRHSTFQHPEDIEPIQPSENEVELQAMDDGDPLGVYTSIFKGETSRNTNLAQLKEKATIMITNKKFQPRQYLLQVHQNTSYNQLLDGEERLRQGVDQEAEALKNLVHQNFDRFVSAKNTIDHVYDEMRSKQLNKEQDYGTVGLQKSLKDANERAKQIYGPVVDRRQRVEKVKSTLTMLQRYRFLFNLPSSLLEFIKQSKYEAAIRDYKKGKYLYQVLKGDLDSTDSTDLDQKENRITDLHLKVFDKVWAEVGKIVSELQNVLLKMLSDPWRSMEEQEKTINFLFDLDTTEDPAWFYLNSQHQWITSLMKETFDEAIQKIQRLKSENPTEESSIARSVGLKRAIGQIAVIKDIKEENGIDAELQVWRATCDLVKSLSSLLLRCLPDFWRLSTAFIEEKFANKAITAEPFTRRRRVGMNMNKVDQCRRMTRDIIEQYATLLSDYFSLEDENQKDLLPSFLPSNANSIYTSHYLTLVITDMAACVNDISGIDLAGEIFSGLTDLMQKARSKFIDIVCLCWQRDALTFYLLEEWVVDPQNTHITTLLKRYYDFHKFCARSAHRIASLTAVSDTDDQTTIQISPVYIEKIRSSFMESTFVFLDGLVRLAVTDYTPLNEKEELILAKKRGNIDVHSTDIRMLLILSNMEHMRENVIKKLIELFEVAFNVRMDEDLKTLVEVINELDKEFFGDYIRRKSSPIRTIIRQGILESGIDWFSIPKPQEVHPFVYESLMTLVTIHSEISSVTKQLVKRALSRFLETMAKDCLDSFKQVKRFGMGGMLQATLEIEFMHQTLSQYVTPDASATLQNIYQTIERAYDPEQQSSENIKLELGNVKELLVFSRVCVSRPFYYGSIAYPLNGKKASDPDHTHRWTVMVKGLNNEDLTYYVKKVVFKLHETYPNPIRTIEQPPFEVSETGWGEFEIMIKIYFHPCAVEKPAIIYHHLRLHPFEDDLNGQPWPKDKPVMSLLYDELVFNEPTEQLYQIFSENRALQPNLPNKKAIRDSTMPQFSIQLEQEENDRLDRAQKEINLQMTALKQKLAALE
ncbi:exocyst complex component Sec5-domain-containing protein [Sporodiniella umbellata]|nr:exocyst complex component Sec5-domain-containing protein [Sporodiniella umbellata]